MKKTAFIILAGALTLTLSAEGSDRGYFTVGAGVVLPAEEADLPVYFTNLGVETNTDTGFLLSCAGGLWILKNLRLEGEVGYNSNDIDDVKVTYRNIVGIGVDGGSGDIASLSFMVNTWYDFFPQERLIPYLGGGIGAAQVSLENFSINTYPIVPDAPRTKRELVDDEDWQFAYQAGAGLGYELNESMIIDFGYRYFATLDPEFTDKGGNKVKTEHARHNFLLAIRYKF